ncbi:MBL fold metallo-hydrolase [Marinicella sp. S1101]|uniref:MBL fold metallo-hydrolase n=1 Tax=Marinicella marina TaxID=2996016 RepID=UPI002260BFA3|nr:MBL fold metallo-hydrolase [Marinicella marina]MCX7553439.1 MBL fold metallo-hydrolase [Marinicella marina]MDJ1140063.1 MBL fold metallo-hydrolase [Marinicella marina]
MFKKSITLLVLIVAFAMLTACWRSVSYIKPKVAAAHHGEDNFISKAQKTSPLFSYLKMRIKEGGMPEIPADVRAQLTVPIQTALIAQPPIQPQLTWLGHATVLVQHKGVNFLTDPHLSQYASPVKYFGPKRIIPAALNVEQLPKIDFVVISHNHYDHLDHETVVAIGNTTTWLVPMGLKQWLMKRDINEANIVELDWWQRWQYAENVSITATPSQHWSKRTPFDTNKSLWASWHVDIDGFKTWFAGDTGYAKKAFQRIGEELGPHDLALIPIGAYAPKYFMLPQHVDPAQALQTHLDVKSELSLGIHWGTFQLTHEPFWEPKNLLEKALLDQQPVHPFMTLKVGESYSVVSD